MPSTRVWKCPDLLPHLLFAAAPGIPASYQQFLPEMLSVDLGWRLVGPTGVSFLLLGLFGQPGAPRGAV